MRRSTPAAQAGQGEQLESAWSARHLRQHGVEPEAMQPIHDMHYGRDQSRSVLGSTEAVKPAYNAVCCTPLCRTHHTTVSRLLACPARGRQQLSLAATIARMPPFNARSPDAHFVVLPTCNTQLPAAASAMLPACSLLSPAATCPILQCCSTRSPVVQFAMLLCCSKLSPCGRASAMHLLVVPRCSTRSPAVHLAKLVPLGINFPLEHQLLCRHTAAKLQHVAAPFTLSRCHAAAHSVQPMSCTPAASNACRGLPVVHIGMLPCCGALPLHHTSVALPQRDSTASCCLQHTCPGHQCNLQSWHVLHHHAFLAALPCCSTSSIHKPPRYLLPHYGTLSISATLLVQPASRAADASFQ
jgi:hypothetical protein